MEALAAYVIPVTTLRTGHNELEFKADWRFFRHFEESPIQQGSFEIGVLFDKQPDHWYLHFEVEGLMDTECDRCLAMISLPLSGSYSLFVKFDEEEQEFETSEDVIYVPRETTHFNIAQYLYEFIVLSVPVSKVYDCQAEANPPCDMEMLAKLEPQGEDESTNPLGELLKKIQIDPEG